MKRATWTLAAAAILAAAGAAPSAAGMEIYRWKNRPLVVFAASEIDTLYRRQVGILSANRSGLTNRDMVVIHVVGTRVFTTIGRGPGLSAAALRRRYGIAPSAFRAILVGKDGGAKLSSSAPLSTARLFSTIDAMPMRRQEMNSRGQ